MGNVPPASYSTKAEQLLPTDRSSAAQDLHFDDDDYDSDFPDSTARPVPSPASQSVKFYTLADVLALVREGISQNAHDHLHLLDCINTLERNLSQRIDRKQQVESRPAASSPSSPIPSLAELTEKPSESIAKLKHKVNPSPSSEGKDEVDASADMPSLITLNLLEEQHCTATTPVKLASADDTAIPVNPTKATSSPLVMTSPAHLASVSPRPERSPSTLLSSELFLAEIEKHRNAMDRLSFSIRRFAVPPCTSPITAEDHAASLSSAAAEQPHYQVPASISLSSFVKQSIAEKASPAKEKRAILPSLPGSPTSQAEEQETYLTVAKAEIRLQEQARQLSVQERVLARKEQILAREQAHLDAEKDWIEIKNAELDGKKLEVERREKEWQMRQHAELVGMREQMARLRELIHDYEEQKRANEISPG